MTQQPYGQPPQATTPPQQHTPAPSASDILGGGEGGGKPTFKLGKKHQPAGEFRGGRILNEPGVYHVQKPGKPGEARVPLYYQKGPRAGEPVWGVYVDVPTAERDPMIDGDDGVRRIYIEGMWLDAYASKKRAVIEAVSVAAKETGRQLKGIERGGEIYLAWTHEVETGAATPAQNWVAKYVPPPSASSAVLAPPVEAQQYAAPAQAAPVAQAVQQPAAQPVQAAPQPAAQPAGSAHSAEQLAAFRSIVETQGGNADATLRAIGQDPAAVRVALGLPPY